MHISQEKLDEFQGRMSNWVSSQGLLFQLRHGGSVRGAHSSVVLWFVRMAVRVSVMVLVASLVFWIYLTKRVDFGGFRSELNESIAAGLRAEGATAGGIRRSRGSLLIGKISLTGGEESFFDEITARGVRTKMGLLDGVVSSWNGEAVKIDKLEMSLKSGAENAETGAEIFQRLFQKTRKFQFNQVDIEHATLDWGYSGVTRGSIEDAKIRALRKESGWNLRVSGGYFSQNWLQRLEIESMKIDLLPSGLVFRDVKLKRGSGTVEFQARIEGPVNHPTISGSGTMQALSIDGYLVPEVREFVGADLSGTFTLGGSPYAASGVTMKAEITLAGDDRIELRNRIPLFRSISVVDRLRSYRNLKFRSGHFKLDTGGGVAVITDIWLSAKEVMLIKGELMVEPPTRDEVDEALLLRKRGLPEDGTAPGNVDPNTAEADQGTVVGKKLTLEELAKAARSKGREEQSADSFAFQQGFNKDEWKKHEDAAREREKRVPRLRGRLHIGLNAQAFERAPELIKLYPIDPNDQMRWLEIPLDGSIYGAGVPLAEEILNRSGTGN